jgi:hypothetical protein
VVAFCLKGSSGWVGTIARLKSFVHDIAGKPLILLF